MAPPCQRCEKMPGRQCRACALIASANHLHDVYEAEVARQLYRSDVAHRSAGYTSALADALRDAAERCGWRAVALDVRDRER